MARISLHAVLQALPPGCTYEESLMIMPQAASWLEREKNRLEGMYAFQESFWSNEGAAGCDEVGRGPLAGPLVAAAVILPPHTWIPGLNDSKKLNEEVREQLVPWIKKLSVAWHIQEISAAELDRLNNINTASLQTMRSALYHLKSKAKFVFIDGRSPMPECPVPQTAVIKGDGRIPAIAAASIIAKVYRDHLLDSAHQSWPQYQFNENKGYGTAAHLEALRRCGPCPYHRRSFTPIRQLLTKFSASSSQSQENRSEGTMEQAVLF
ncbi:MAG: ribonuclease HII [Candidatus Bruticola sp.]